MGEIADALKRAGTTPSRPARKKADAETRDAPVYSRAIDVEAVTVAEEAAALLDERARADELAEDVAADEPRHTIPVDQREHWISRAVLVAPNGPAAECFRHLAIRVSRELEDRKLASLLVVSGLRREGKTTTACNLALALAPMGGGRRIALVDLDLRKPSLARVFALAPEIGFEEVLSGHASLSDVRVRTDLDGLDLFPVARAVAQPHELLAGGRLGEALRELENAYDTVIIDSAPLLLVPDTELLYPHVGGIAAVMRAGTTRRADFERLIEAVPETKLIGTFMNDVRKQRHIKRYGYYGREG